MSKPRHRPHSQLTDALVLAALERAVRHRTADSPAAPIWAILDHLSIPRRSADARRVRALLDELTATGKLKTSRPHGIEAWTLTAAGQRRLRGARRADSLAPLPESPQHRQWQSARTAAGQEIERFAERLRECLADATLLLDTDPHAPSDMWFELAEALRNDCWRLGSAVHCLDEWPEPSDEIADVDTHTEASDAALEADERHRRSVRRMGRRSVRLWQERG